VNATLHATGLGAVLFDLDGTLLDTAPDMVGSLTALQTEEGDAPIRYDIGRAYVSNGVTGLLRVAFGDIGETRRERLRRRFLEIYAGRLARETMLFPGMEELLARLDAFGTPWGVVTNKPSDLTEPLLRDLGLRQRCACVVSGDTLAQRKPHPEPLLFALSQIPVRAELAVYIGDAHRDVIAGRAAGMRTVAATYGYIPPEEDPQTWGADALASDASTLLRLIEAYRK
jgi:phosphoglycolate phosphatase